MWGTLIRDGLIVMPGTKIVKQRIMDMWRHSLSGWLHITRKCVINAIKKNLKCEKKCLFHFQTVHHRTDTCLNPNSQQEKQHMCYQLVGLNLFFLMTMQAAAQEMQALSIPGRDSETPEVINSSWGCWRSAWHPAPDSMFLSSVFC